MAELADAPDLGSGSERSEGSSPFIRIKSLIVKTQPQPISRGCVLIGVNIS
jgi:hypothetical protein